MATNADIAPLLVAKQQRRRELAAWEEKVAIAKRCGVCCHAGADLAHRGGRRNPDRSVAHKRQGKKSTNKRINRITPGDTHP
jgi:hypothetical protein